MDAQERLNEVLNDLEHSAGTLAKMKSIQARMEIIEQSVSEVVDSTNNVISALSTDQVASVQKAMIRSVEAANQAAVQLKKTISGISVEQPTAINTEAQKLIAQIRENAQALQTAQSQLLSKIRTADQAITDNTGTLFTDQVKATQKELIQSVNETNQTALQLKQSISEVSIEQAIAINAEANKLMAQIKECAQALQDAQNRLVSKVEAAEEAVTVNIGTLFADKVTSAQNAMIQSVEATNQTAVQLKNSISAVSIEQAITINAEANKLIAQIRESAQMLQSAQSQLLAKFKAAEEAVDVSYPKQQDLKTIIREAVSETIKNSLTPLENRIEKIEQKQEEIRLMQETIAKSIQSQKSGILNGLFGKR